MLVSWEKFERMPEVRRGETLENLMTYWLARLHQAADLYAMFGVTPSGRL